MLDWLRDAQEDVRRKAAGDLIPTWQVGLRQDPEDNVTNFATDGYARNSLIYACIRERATAFSPLPVQVLRPQTGADVERPAMVPVVDHPFVELLNDPNDIQDGGQFAEELVTHLDISGNVYIEKVPRSENVNRRRRLDGLDVQELSVIRPDYIKIIPGTTRERDTYAVVIEGRERRRIPRARMIHLKLPNPANDFYGLSPIATLINEGNVDRSMTEFEYAFFRNAGVPMGVITTKKRTSVDETAQIKSQWRQAFNGVRRWFDVLVTNADVMEYKPLAIPQKDMELENTRDLVESRICAVYGVPPIIVGALVGLKRSTYDNYERARQSFVSETLVPLASFFAKGLERELFADLRVTADRGAHVAYDFSGVKALADQQAAKLEAAARLINTGAYTVNQAHRLMGIEEIAGADFYVRNLNQIAEAEALSGERPAPAEPPPVAVQASVAPAVRKHIERDDEGRIKSVTEEPVQLEMLNGHR